VEVRFKKHSQKVMKFHRLFISTYEVEIGQNSNTLDSNG